MRVNRIPVVLIALVFVVPVVLLQASPTRAACPAPQTMSPDDAFLASLGVAPEEPLQLSTPATKGQKAGGLHPSRRTAALECEWFDITCSDGRTEECCGTVNGCLVTCVDVCGEPCIYIPE